MVKKLESEKLYLPENYPTILAEIAEIIRLRLRQESCLEDDKACQIALDAAEHVRQQFGGQASIYIPIGLSYDCAQRDLEIYSAWTGHNFSEVAKKFKLSEMRVRQIVRYVSAHERAKRQSTLFGADF